MVIGRSFRLDPSRVFLPSAQLALGDEPIARKMRLDVMASLGPYAPHDHPGLEGFDFLSGSVQARGEVPELPFLERTQLVATGTRVPGALVADVRIDRGRLTTGSRFDVTAPAAGTASPFAITTTVTTGPGGPLFHFGVAAKGLTAGRRPRRPPFFRAAAVTVDTKTPETRLSRLFATARDLRDPQKPAITLPLISDVQATGVSIDAPSARASLRATLDRAGGRIDLAGLLSQRVDVQGLQADGVAVRLNVAKGAPAASAAPAWSVRMAGVHLTHIREVVAGDYRLAGDSQVDCAFSYAPDGTLAVQKAAFRLPAGRFEIAGQTVAQALSARIDARVDPSVLGETSGLAVLRLVSGSAASCGPASPRWVSSTPICTRLPGWALQGGGRSARTCGSTMAGSPPAAGWRWRPCPSRRRSSTAWPPAGERSTSPVTGQGAAARTALAVRLDRFVCEDLRQQDRPDYLRGRGLRLSAVVPGALDLAAPMPDFDATLDMPDAEVPDLTVYDALLPREGGLWIVSGRGRARLHLEASTATNRTRGAVVLTSDDARVRFQNLELAGRLDLQAPLVSSDLAGRRFDLAGTRLALAGVSYRNVEARNRAGDAGLVGARRAERRLGGLGRPAVAARRGEGRHAAAPAPCSPCSPSAAASCAGSTTR